MKVKQISIFLENKSGRLADVTTVLGKEDINIRALSIADTSDFGILRLIVDQPKKALEILKAKNFTVSETEVIAVEVSDDPGGLSQALAALKEENINIEYMYAFIEKSSEDALVVFRVEEISAAISVLEEKGFNLLKAEEVYKL
ncbi:ACT domain-containing protein [Acetohalobium arabaticum]|uniref:ACT domain protein n=1 Tax=Acetohalobium arabaticum (strain ATCC 49924 / DSM 5501 / Z-7288) TaxID=574087 RepID=D9QS03_ACEAZ|nr:ACT domain-containing protein [Acetohalobium arabaticum]ADL13294.1 ACT domain protein [Acetohalobium arabaticum DSM 5501]